MTPSFNGFAALPAPVADQMQQIWPRVRESMTLPDLTLPSHPVDAAACLNWHVNREIRYQSESRWQQPSETLSLGSGDCKDYATLKYAALRGMVRMTEDDLAVVVGEIRAMPQNLPHAWCAARIGGAWLVLDNKFDQIIGVEDYINWTPLKACSTEEIVLYARSFALADHVKQRA